MTEDGWMRKPNKGTCLSLVRNQKVLSWYFLSAFVSHGFGHQMDLESTIGETAALGASGVVLWGASSDYETKVGLVGSEVCSAHRLHVALEPSSISYQRKVSTGGGG